MLLNKYEKSLIVIELIMIILYCIGADFMIYEKIFSDSAINNGSLNVYRNVGISLLSVAGLFTIIAIVVLIIYIGKNFHENREIERDSPTFIYYSLRCLFDVCIIIVGIVLILIERNQIEKKLKYDIMRMIGWCFLSNGLIMVIPLIIFGIAINYKDFF